MRTVTVENNQIVVRVDGMPIRYGMSIIQKRIKELAVELETWREYERLLTPLAVDVAESPQKCTTEKLCPVHNVWHASPPRH